MNPPNQDVQESDRQETEQKLLEALSEEAQEMKAEDWERLRSGILVRTEENHPGRGQRSRPASWLP